MKYDKILFMDNAEIIASLRTLGLDAGATSEDIRTAFRRLALELHPDITGSKSDFRFKQITGAYNVLKNLTPEELASLPPTVQKRNIYDYYSETKKQRADSEKVDAILDKYEQEIKAYYSSKSVNEDSDMEAIIFRLKSQNPGVINATLKHSLNLANKVEFRRALVEILKRPVIDESTAEITSSFPFDDMTRKLIAMDSSENAQNFPTVLIIGLIGNDSDVMESFLLHVKPDDVAVILRRWPAGKAMSQGVVRKLLDSDDARILVPILGTMRSNFPQSASVHKKGSKLLRTTL